MAFTRRHLPHWIPSNAIVFVTSRLAGSFPPDARQEGQIGPVWPQDPQIASMIGNALIYGETVRQSYTLRAWVIMPNHVHAILQPRVDMPTIMRWLEGRTSRVANQILDRTGAPFWQDESFDHWVRSAEEFQDLIEYVENNPVKAGFVEAKEQWPWSSAGWQGGTDHRLLWSVMPR
jgi:REP element-mobilizing transposase RayT